MVRILERSDNKAVYEIEGEDHTLGNLLEKLLVGDDRVSFASYENPHPLENKIVVTIVTKGEPPDKLLREALERIIEMAREFREDYLKALERAGIRLEE
ncbi:MAG: RNA polymerase [Desulfurococcales archaeon]|nr:RNA polymerase [Desulfurococcales archaeon]